jgi:hypothetical protein
LQSDQSWQWAEYNTFIVDDESTQYTLHIGDFNGTAYDGMTTTVVYFNLDGMKFSTFDSDNDPIDLNCALMYEAGFWYNNCGWVYVNSYGSSFQWQYSTLQTSRMTLISRY